MELTKFTHVEIIYFHVFIFLEIQITVFVEGTVARNYVQIQGLWNDFNFGWACIRRIFQNYKILRFSYRKM